MRPLADPISESQRYSPRPLTEGENWTAEELSRLRSGRYRPRAWVRFLRSSAARSRKSRAARPGMASQAASWGLAGGVAWIAACVLARNRTELRLQRVRGLLWWLSVWRMLDWHLGMAEGGDGRARTRLASADAVTLTRFWLVPVALGTARSERGLSAVIAVGGASDWLDGALARRSGRTRLGRDLDTTADLAFLTAATIAARRQGRISSPASTVLLARNTVGMGIALTAVFGQARRPAIRARRWGAALRIAGLLASAAGARRPGSALLLVGGLVPPRRTAPHLSLF